MQHPLRLRAPTGDRCLPTCLPVAQPPPCSLHINHFWVIPKAQPGKLHLIFYLSFPDGTSNEGILSDLCTLCYLSIDVAIQQILQAGRGTQLSKLDIKDVYRIVLVHPDDCPLLGVKGRDTSTWIRGCRSAFGQHPNSSLPLLIRCNG